MAPVVIYLVKFAYTEEGKLERHEDSLLVDTDKGMDVALEAARQLLTDRGPRRKWSSVGVFGIESLGSIAAHA